jgi:hypothetical protein
MGCFNMLIQCDSDKQMRSRQYKPKDVLVLLVTNLFIYNQTTHH